VDQVLVREFSHLRCWPMSRPGASMWWWSTRSPPPTAQTGDEFSFD